MKKIIPFLLVILSTFAANATNVKISDLPLGNAATVGLNDSFPYVAASTDITKRLTLWSLINLPPFVSTYAPLASPHFTGTATFAGPVTMSSTLGVTGAISTNSMVIGSSAGTISGLSTIVNTGTLTLPTATTTLVGRTTTDTLTSKTLTAPIISTIVNTGTLTLPTSTDTLVGRATTDTLTNKSMSFASNTFSGQLGISNGGTGQSTKAAAFDALSPMTTSGDIIYGGVAGTGTRLPKGSNGQVLTLSGGLPVWAATSAAPVPTIQVFTSSSGTYTTPVGATWLKIKMVGAGAGGGGSQAGSAGGTGGDTTFGTGTAFGGAGGGGGGGGGAGAGGAGGGWTLGSGWIGTGYNGGQGGGGGGAGGGPNLAGGQGGASCVGGNGAAGRGAATGGTAPANTGGGGGGGGGIGNNSGGGGGSGGCLEAIISSPSATYAYGIGTGGGAGAGGSAGGGAGGDGIIVVEEHYN